MRSKIFHIKTCIKHSIRSHNDRCNYVHPIQLYTGETCTATASEDKKWSRVKGCEGRRDEESLIGPSLKLERGDPGCFLLRSHWFLPQWGRWENRHFINSSSFNESSEGPISTQRFNTHQSPRKHNRACWARRTQQMYAHTHTYSQTDGLQAKANSDAELYPEGKVWDP